MQRTVRASRSAVAEPSLVLKIEDECDLHSAHAPAVAATNTTNGEIARNCEVGSMADDLDMNRPWVHFHGRVTPAESLRRFWRCAGRCGFGGCFRAF